MEKLWDRIERCVIFINIKFLLFNDIVQLIKVYLPIFLWPPSRNPDMYM